MTGVVEKVTDSFDLRGVSTVVDLGFNQNCTQLNRTYKKIWGEGVVIRYYDSSNRNIRVARSHVNKSVVCQ